MELREVTQDTVRIGAKRSYSGHGTWKHGGAERSYVTQDTVRIEAERSYSGHGTYWS